VSHFFPIWLIADCDFHHRLAWVFNPAEKSQTAKPRNRLTPAIQQRSTSLHFATAHDRCPLRQLLRFRSVLATESSETGNAGSFQVFFPLRSLCRIRSFRRPHQPATTGGKYMAVPSEDYSRQPPCMRELFW
jgi:hypothetical protein